MKAVVRRRGPRLHRELAKYIVPGERVLLSVRRHWFSLAHEIAYVAIALFFAITIDIAAPANGRLLSDVAWFAFWGSSAWLLWNYLNWRNDYFVASDKRFLLFYGFIRRKVAMMPLVKVTDLTFDRPLIGRMLGYGHFVLESAGQEQALAHIGMIPDADHNYRLICSELFGRSGDVDVDDIDWRDGGGPPSAGPNSGGPNSGGGSGPRRPGSPDSPEAPESPWEPAQPLRAAPRYDARHGHGELDDGTGMRHTSVDEGATMRQTAAGEDSLDEASDPSWYRSDQRLRRPLTPDTGEVLYVPRDWS